jgi:hypothetical protein
MKWFDRWFARKCEQVWNESREKQKIEDHSLAVGSNVFYKDSVAEHVLEDCDHYSLKIWKAHGGRCVQYKRYDRARDKLHTNLHVVPESEDLGDAIKNIVIQEALVGN